MIKRNKFCYKAILLKLFLILLNLSANNVLFLSNKALKLIDENTSFYCRR